MKGFSQAMPLYTLFLSAIYLTDIYIYYLCIYYLLFINLVYKYIYNSNGNFLIFNIVVMYVTFV